MAKSKHRFGISAFQLTVLIHFYVNFGEKKSRVFFFLNLPPFTVSRDNVKLDECKPLHVGYNKNRHARGGGRAGTSGASYDRTTRELESQEKEYWIDSVYGQTI